MNILPEEDEKNIAKADIETMKLKNMIKVKDLFSDSSDRKQLNDF